MEADSPAGLPRIPGGASPAGGVEGLGPDTPWLLDNRTSAESRGTSWGKKGLSFQLDLEQARENL